MGDPNERAIRSARAARRSTFLGLITTVIGLALTVACAPKQVIPLYVTPEAVTVYVDGEALAVAPAQLELRSDRDHKLYFKRQGFRPEMVVLRQAQSGGPPRLEPAEVRVELSPLAGPAHKDLVIELED